MDVKQNLHVEPKLQVGANPGTSNALEIDGNVNITGDYFINGESLTHSKKSIVLTAAGAYPSATSGCNAPTQVEMTTNKQSPYVLTFPPDSNTYAELYFLMPDSYDGGTLNARFTWMANSTMANAVKWSVQGRCYGDGDNLDQPWGTAQTVVDNNNSSAYQVRISNATPDFTLAGSPAGGKLVALKLGRLGEDAADTLDANAQLLAVILEYSISSWSD